MMEGSAPQAFQIVPGALTCHTQSLGGGRGAVAQKDGSLSESFMVSGLVLNQLREGGLGTLSFWL